MQPKISDAELIVKANSSKTKEEKNYYFSQLIERHYKALESFVSGLMRKNTDEVTDVVHDAIIKIYENLNSFQNKSEFLTWASSIARNIWLSQLRDAQRKPPYVDVNYENFLEYYRDDITDDPEYAELHTQVEEAFTDQDSPELIYEGTETLEKIQAGIKVIHPHLQDLYEMRYIDQMSYNEIAADLGLPVGTVSRNIYELNTIIQDIINE